MAEGVVLGRYTLDVSVSLIFSNSSEVALLTGGGAGGSWMKNLEKSLPEEVVGP